MTNAGFIQIANPGNGYINELPLLSEAKYKIIPKLLVNFRALRLTPIPNISNFKHP
jgi:hypothetical protein